MRAVTEASACPSHFAMTANGTPKVHRRRVVQTDRTHTRRLAHAMPHLRQCARGIRFAGLVDCDVPAVRVRFAERQPLPLIAR